MKLNDIIIISEPARIEILRRLAILNKQRWQEEQEAENGK